MRITGAGGCAKDLVAMLELESTSYALAFFDEVNADAPDLLFGKYPVLRSRHQAADYFENSDGRFVGGYGRSSYSRTFAADFCVTR